MDSSRGTTIKIFAESKGRLLEQIKKDEIVHLAVRDVRRRADRIYVWRVSQRWVVLYNITSKNCLLRMNVVRRVRKFLAINHLITNFTSYITDVMDGKMFYSDISKMSDIGLRSLNQSNGTKSHCLASLYDKEGHLVKHVVFGLGVE